MSLTERIYLIDHIPWKLVWSDGMTPGVSSNLTVKQRDRLIHRGAWQYGERTQHIAMLQQGG
jgi:CRISPR system Cascade subunit CasD